MKQSKADKIKAIVAGMTLSDAESLCTEIADYTLTHEGLQADVAAIYRKLDAKKARLAAKVEPVVSQKNAAMLAVERSRNERWELLESWAENHKATLFADPRSIKMLRGVIGFRQGPPKLSFLAGFTAKLSAVLLRKRAWGADYLIPAKLSHEAILRDEGEFLARPARLASVGLAITRQETFYFDVERTGTDSTGKENP